MVTLAFAQVGAILVARDFGGLTGGEEGLPLDVVRAARRAGRRGQHGQPVLAGAGVPGRGGRSWCTGSAGSPTGRVLAGLRDDERRIGVLGLDPYRFKLVAFTLAGGLAAAGGVVYC